VNDNQSEATIDVTWFAYTHHWGALIAEPWPVALGKACVQRGAWLMWRAVIPSCRPVGAGLLLSCSRALTSVFVYFADRPFVISSAGEMN